MTAIPIAIAIIANKSGQLLIAKRKDDAHLGGYWEFPGGKCEQDESQLDALIRECREELNIEVIKAHKFMQFEHAYPERLVELICFIVTEYQGEPESNEGQELAWVDPDQLKTVEFPPGNVKLIEFLTNSQTQVVSML